MSEVTGCLIQSALGKMADEILAREQLHIIVEAETGYVSIKPSPFASIVYSSMADFLEEGPMWIPSHGRVWVHVE